MSERKNEGLELRPNNRPISPETEKSSFSSDDQLSFSSSSSSSSIISYSSNVTTEDNAQSANGRSVTKAMVVVGCRRCYLYVISSEVDPRCPKCNNTVFFDLFRENILKADN